MQGTGQTSPLVGQTVTVQGIVVGDHQDDGLPDSTDGQIFFDLDGFYLQEEQSAPDSDGNPQTSDGIFIHALGGLNVQAGDEVRVTGQVAEFVSSGSSLTQLTGVTYTVCGAGVVPAPQQLVEPATDVAEYEKYEGMLVQYAQPLRISEYFNYDRFGEIVLCQPYAADPLTEQDRLYQPTAIDQPESPARAARAAYNALACITLDDGRTAQNPDPARHPNGDEFTTGSDANEFDGNRFRGGDIVQDTTGILDHRFGLYRIQPTTGATYVATNPRQSQPDPVGGSLQVASFNVLNFFTTLGSRGADTAEEFERQRTKIIEALYRIDADIVGLIEIQNNTEAIQNLVDGLNQRYGSEVYTYIPTGTIGTDEIKLAIIYKPATVTPLGAYETLDSSDDPRFVDTRNRPALAQTFLENSAGGVFTFTVNHFKSKGSGCGGAPDDDPIQGNCNGTRRLAAEALVDWLATDPTNSNDPDFLIMGDLNAYDKEDPIDEIREGADDTPGTADDYSDLEFVYNGEYAYSYLFDSQFGYLDYAMAIQSLAAQTTGATTWHINSDEPDLLDYDMSFKLDAQDELYEPNPFRASDHDPVIVGLNLLSSPVTATPVATTTPPMSTPTIAPTATPFYTPTTIPTATPPYTPTPQPAGALVINEIDYDQPGTDAAEFIELYNNDTVAINLDPYTIVGINGVNGGSANYRTIELPPVTLAPGDYYVVCSNAATVPNCDLDADPNIRLDPERRTRRGGPPASRGDRWTLLVMRAMSLATLKRRARPPIRVLSTSASSVARMAPIPTTTLSTSRWHLLPQAPQTAHLS